MPASLIAAGDALARFFAAPEIGSVPHRSARQGILILVAFIGGMLPISNMAMLSSAYLALSGNFNADLIDLGRLALGNLLLCPDLGKLRLLLDLSCLVGTHRADNPLRI